jgi:hypothetical protein
MFAGTIGEGPATEYLAFLSLYENLPDIDGLLLNPEEADVPTDPGTLYAICSALVNRFADGKSFDQGIKYIARLPKEFEVFTVKSAVKTAKTVVTSTKAFIRWAVDNKEVICD